MNKYLFIPLALFLGLALVFFVVLMRGRDPREVPSPLINKSAPAFQLPQLHDPAKTFSAESMRGKVWVLNFWGTWCIACREEHPLLVEFAKSGELPIYGVDYKDDREAAKQWFNELGNPYALIAFDVEGRTSIDYGVYGAPESYLIDKNGVIRFKQIGPITREVWNNQMLPMARELNK
jgi:cytochrome c biogenesis protein CcmG, thiol:disulfide interchange protein DsbE